MDKEMVLHRIENGRYRVVFERSAVKGQDGFKVEANSDDLTATETDAILLYAYAKEATKQELLKQEV